MGEENGPMTDDEISAIIRMETKSPGLTTVRRDLYKAMATHQKVLKTEYSNLLSKDPDSIIAEGLNQRRKSCMENSQRIVSIRTKKILNLASRASEGADVPIDKLTEEERTFFYRVLALCREQKDIFKRLNGTQKYISPDISAAPSPKPAPAPVAEDRPAEEDTAVPPVTAEEFPVEGSRTEEPAIPPVDEEDFPIEDEPDFSEEEFRDIPADELDVPPAAAEPVGENAPSDTAAPDYREKGMLMIRVTADGIPTFAGSTQNYTLRKEDVVLMPENLAQVLINRDMAVEVKPSP